LAKKKGRAKAGAEKGIRINPGAVVLDSGSSRAYHTGEWRTFRPVINQDKCIKCYQCWQACPDAAIRIDRETGKVYIDYTYCKGCLICVKHCPVKAIDKALEEK
jgi:2-oxoacid:acceptor oxidoreductase delta subunit (pyruvate/2-ketoisovalerate family)